MVIFLTGFIASLAHVITGPDHLAAVTPLAIDSRKRSWMVGLSWGLGHTIGMLLIGLLFILFKEFLPINAISKHSETLIGILLIGIGCWALVRIYLHHPHAAKVHAHFHSKPFLYAHIHKHTHVEENASDQNHGHEHHHDSLFQLDHGHDHSGKINQNTFAAFLIGIFHGFAGFSHLLALLPSLALPTVWDSVSYIIAFAFGTIVTMILYALILGFVAFRSVLKDKLLFLNYFSLTGALLALIVGIFWIVYPV